MAKQKPQPKRIAPSKETADYYIKRPDKKAKKLLLGYLVGK